MNEVFFHKRSRFTGQQRKGVTISLASLCLFHPFRSYLDISRAITLKSSALYIVSSRTRTGTCGYRVQVGNHQATRFITSKNSFMRLNCLAGRGKNGPLVIYPGPCYKTLHKCTCKLCMKIMCFYE